MEKHFCTCPVNSCTNHPDNHSNGCDLCIKKNLAQGEIPACFFLAISSDVEGLTEFTVESFVDFYLKNKDKVNHAKKM